jgi:DNA repair protein RecO (recombination protein O)
MLHKTRGVVLRTIKYGDTSIIATVFTELYGVQSYLVQGIRSARPKQHRAGLLQPASLLDLVVYHKQQHGLQRIKEFQLAHIYITLQEEIVKNSIALFSAEVLLRLLPEHAPLPEVFAFIFDFFQKLDEWPAEHVANFPVYFIIQISRLLGYEINGTHSAETPHLNLQEGSFTESIPHIGPCVYFLYLKNII